MIRSAFIISSCTLISRILGYIRDILVSQILGTSIIYDAFLSAFKLANMFRNIFAEGSVNLIFLPEFSKELKLYGKDKALKFASTIHSLLIIVLIVFCTLVIIFMPEIIWYFAPGYRDDVEIYKLAILFGRITFPYLFCVSLGSFYNSILNNFDKFFPFSVAPIILNIVVVGFLLFFNNFKTSAHTLSIATLVGGILELLWMIYFLLYNRCQLKLFKIKFNKKIIRSTKNIIFNLTASSIIHVNTWFNMFILSFFPSGLSYMYYADRIVQLPLALISIPFCAILLPRLTKNDNYATKDTICRLENNAINFIMMLTIPCTAGIFFLAQKIICLLFERGEFNKLSTLSSSKILEILVFGLPAFILTKLFQIKFYARFNNKIPVLVSVICVSINILISILLKDQYQYSAVAIANVISSWSNMTILVFYAYRLLDFKLQAFVIYECIKYFIASIIMIIILFIFEITIMNINNKLVSLSLEFLIGLVSYLITCYLLNVQILRNNIRLTWK